MLDMLHRNVSNAQCRIISSDSHNLEMLSTASTPRTIEKIHSACLRNMTAYDNAHTMNTAWMVFWCWLSSQSESCVSSQ